MSAMDHAGAHERIEDLLLEPTRLTALAVSSEPDDIALRDHLSGCPVCRADLAGWERLQHRLSAALPGSVEAAKAAVEPVELPPSLRAGVIAAARGVDRSPAPTSIIRAERPRRAPARWLDLAAAFVILAGAGLFTIDAATQRSVAEADARALTSAIAAVNRVLAAPDHQVVALRSPAGIASGSISWSSNDLVVLTTALEPVPATQLYRCWLEENGSSVAVGAMYFAGRTAYWIGSLDEWATFRIGKDTRFVVTLEAVDATERQGPAILSADLGA